MIFTECPKCSEPFEYSYETGEKPFGAGVYGLHICEACKEELLVERISFGGETWIKKDLEKAKELKEFINEH